jgi:hypothetical protein
MQETNQYYQQHVDILLLWWWRRQIDTTMSAWICYCFSDGGDQPILSALLGRVIGLLMEKTNEYHQQHVDMLLLWWWRRQIVFISSTWTCCWFAGGGDHLTLPKVLGHATFQMVEETI